MTFKENCPDLRNSKVIDVIRELQAYDIRVSVHDPLAGAEEALHEYGVELVPWDQLSPAHAIVGAVAHRSFNEFSAAALAQKLVPGGLFVDVKSAFDRDSLVAQGLRVWRL